MSKGLLAAIVIFVGIIGVGLVSLIWGVSVYNTQAGLKNQYEMKVTDNRNEYDNVWKKISQVCQIAESKKDAFKEIFTSYASARTSEGSGKVMTWVKENAPTGVDLKVFDNAQNIIVSSRDAFVMRQKELIAVAESYNKNLVVMPRGFVLKLFGFERIEPKIVTSTRTEEAFQSGKDDDTTLFKKQ